MSRGRVYPTPAAAEYCGIAPQTLRNLLHDEEFPEPHKFGRLNGWFQDQLDPWIAKSWKAPES